QNVSRGERMEGLASRRRVLAKNCTFSGAQEGGGGPLSHSVQNRADAWRRICSISIVRRWWELFCKRISEKGKSKSMAFTICGDWGGNSRANVFKTFSRSVE